MAYLLRCVTRHILSTHSAAKNLVQGPVLFSKHVKRTQISRFYANGPQNKDELKLKGLIIGVFIDNSAFKFTKSATKYNSDNGGKVESILNANLEMVPSLGKGLVLKNVDDDYYAVAVVGLGKEEVGLNTLELLDECRENIRVAAAIGARLLYEAGITEITVESFGQSEAAAEGASLAIWKYDDHRDKEDRLPSAHLELLYEEDKEGWERGLFKAELQNFVRHICETPANYMTASVFARLAEDFLCACSGVNVDIRNEEFLHKNGLHAFLHVGRSSEHKPVLLEIKYCGGKFEERPIMFVGKGVTYDTGSLFLRKCEEMAEYKGDLAGGAVAIAVMRAIAVFQLPINVVCLVPLCENVISGKAIRPGDVVFTCKNHTIQIANPDHEGRVVMADVISYGSKMEPRLLVTLSTQTTGVRAALGASASGVFTNNFTLWQEARKAGSVTGDRVWRLPLWNYFCEMVTSLTNADVTNKGTVPSVGACFLKEFVPSCCEWIHFDITGVALKCDGMENAYYTAGLMTGRPTRTIVQLIYQLSCPPEGKPILEDPCPKQEPCPPPTKTC